jgi:hypothetical protein
VVLANIAIRYALKRYGVLITLGLSAVPFIAGGLAYFI